MLAIGGNELKGRPAYQKGTKVVRLSDNKVFTVEAGKDAATGKDTNVMGIIKEGIDSYVCGVGGRLLDGWDLFREPCQHCGQPMQESA